MSKNKIAIVWKKSIYDNNFSCSCGAKLWDIDKNEETENLGVDEKTMTDCYCMKCKNLVAKVKEFSGEVNGTMGGRWFEDLD